MNISGKTKICGLIGDPVEHTMSPVMHNAAFDRLGLDYAYLPFRVSPEELPRAVGGLRALNVRGFNVTIPHKVAVMLLLDELDSLAEKIGAVNTVVNDNGILKGYNTDASGFLQALLEAGIIPGNKNIVLMGAGGAARAITYILSERKANLTILNRREELDWAEEIAKNIKKDLAKDVPVFELLPEYLEKALDSADILVNATSVGMSPAGDVSPVPADLLKSGLAVVDIVYNPVKTRLLQDAESSGAATVAGLDMLVWQGALAFEKWTGEKPPFYLMKKTENKKNKQILMLNLLIFSCIGIGFMILEISLFQKLILYLGSPTVSLSILLCSLLIGMGLGSYFSKKVLSHNEIKKIKYASIAILAYGIIIYQLLPFVLTQLLPYGTIYKAIVSVISILPLGFFLGVPFPTAITILDKNNLKKYIPWMYGINGTMTVLGSISAVIISMVYGFAQAFLFGLGFYLLIIIFFISNKTNHILDN